MRTTTVKLPRFVIAGVLTIFLVGVLALASLFLTSSNARDNQNSDKQKEMMALVLEWGRLAPFPASATQISIQTEGSSATRSFRASFIAPRQDILSWIENSPGLNEAIAEEVSTNTVWYSIVPGGGANHAEVTIDYVSNRVEIYVYWS